MVSSHLTVTSRVEGAAQDLAIDAVELRADLVSQQKVPTQQNRTLPWDNPSHGGGL